MKKFDMKLIGYIKAFENNTRTKVKNAFINDSGVVVFIVNEGDIGKAIGKSGNTISRLSFKMKKKIRVIEFSEGVLKFVKNIIMPVKAKKIVEEDGKIKISVENSRDKGILIGRDKVKLKEINYIVKRYFDYDVEIV